MDKAKARRIIKRCSTLIDAWKGYSDGRKIIYTHEQYRQAMAVLLEADTPAVELRLVDSAG